MTVAFPNAGPVTLKTNLADYPMSRALKSGEVRSDLVTFDFAGPKLAHEAFKPMVREGTFDAGELAIVTFLQAKAYGKPLVLLPAVVMGRFQHHCITYDGARRALSPRDLVDKRVGVRSYTQTTGAWVRGILQHEYGVDLGRVTWVTMEDAHLAEFRDPPNVERAPPGRTLDQLLQFGEVDAIIPGDPTDANQCTLIGDPQADARRWHQKTGAVSVNHLFVVSKALSETRPDVVREIFRVLLESKKAAPPPADGIDTTPFGVEANRKGLGLIIQYAFEQKLVPARFAVDDLFDETTRALAP